MWAKQDYKKIKKSKAIIAGVVLFCLIMPKIVLAWDPIKDIAGGILYRLTEFIHGFLAFFVRAGADFFEYTLNLGFKSHIEIVKTGWEVTRDFANMFFILFLVIIAFTTILRLPRYGIKDLLPKVILIALLINFSLVIASVIIDFSNITANFFISDIKKYTDASKGGISGTFADSLSLPETQTAIDCDAVRDKKIEECETMEGREKANCEAKTVVWYEDCVRAKGAFFGDWANVLSLLISSTFGSIVLLVAAFTFFAGGILLIIRIIVIWFLLMFVPLVFLCYIMPSLRKNWQTWWSNFLKWCFFAPAYAFFIWLAFKIAVENRNKQLAAGVESTFSGYVDAGPGANLFTADAGQQLIGYAFMIALLLGGLIAAQKFGIYGASTAMNIVNKAKQGTVNWAKRTSMRPVKALGTAVGAGALTAGGKLFGDTKLGRRMRAKATEVRMRPEKYPQNVAYGRLISTMSDQDSMKEMMVKAITPEQRIRKLMATRNVARRGLLRDATAPEAEEAMKTFKSFNDFESYQKLKESRLDAIEDKGEQEETTKKVVQEGNLNKIPAIALKDERVVAAIGRFASAVQIESLRNASPQHTQNLKDSLDTLTTAGNAILAGMSALDQEKIHHSYASQTGDTSRLGAYEIAWAQKANSVSLGRIQNPAHVTTAIAMNIPITKLKEVINKTEDPMVAHEIVRRIEAAALPNSLHEKMLRDPFFVPYK